MRSVGRQPTTTRAAVPAAAALIALGAGAGPAAADDPPGLSAQDSAFVMAAGYAGNFEVAAGALAKARAHAAGVRAFGAQMISDHNKAGARLATLARQEGGTTIPT